MIPLPKLLAKGNWQGRNGEHFPSSPPAALFLPSFPSCLFVRSKAGGSLWLTFHDNMPLEIAVLLINPLDMTDLPQGLAL